MQRDKLSKGARLGSGAYGIVYKAEDKGGNSLAVKRLLVDDTNTFIGSVREADLVSRFKHPHIVSTQAKYGAAFNCPLSPIDKSMGSNIKDDTITFVMERGIGNVYEYFKKPKTLLEVKILMVHLLLGLEYMHGKGVSHQDIKPQNILYFVDENNITSFKIADLGLAYWNNDYGYQSPTVSTSWYRAPEVAFNYVKKTKYNHLIDIWSVGCMFFEFIFGYPLLQHVAEDKNEVIVQSYKDMIPGCGGSITWDQFWAKQQTRYNYYNASTAEVHYMRSFLEGLFCYHPSQRLSATTALNHPFLYSEFFNYINSVRDAFRPIRDPYPMFGNISCAERQFGVLVTTHLLQTRNEEIVNEHYRPLFHAMMLFDKAICHNMSNREPKYPQISNTNGLYWSFDGTVVRFMVCYYIIYKYFGLLKPSIQWKDLLVDRYCSADFLRLAEEFEKYVVVDVCNFQLYQQTPIDIAGSMGIKLDRTQIAGLFEYYVHNMWIGVTSEMILDSYLKYITRGKNKKL